MKKLRLLIRSILNFFHITAIVELRIAGYLVNKGWYNSYHTKKSIDANKQSIPWLTYPFIFFIQNRLHAELSIFEYGSGDSSLWYAARVKQIDAVENHYEWYQYVASRKAVNMDLKYIALDDQGTYARAIHINKTQYDIIVIDGRNRNACIEESCKALSPTGVIILDNSERPKYQSGVAYLKQQGFKQLEFEGFSPVTVYTNVTSLFYKADNCLGV